MAFESKTLQCSLLTAHTGRGIEGCLICDPRTWLPVRVEYANPPADTGWHLHAIRPLPTGDVYQVDGVTVDDGGWREVTPPEERRP